MQQLGVLFDSALLLAEVQTLASVEKKECQTLSTLLSHVNGIYELKIITEQFTGHLCEEMDESGKLWPLSNFNRITVITVIAVAVAIIE